MLVNAKEIIDQFKVRARKVSMIKFLLTVKFLVTVGNVPNLNIL